MLLRLDAATDFPGGFVASMGLVLTDFPTIKPLCFRGFLCLRDPIDMGRDAQLQNNNNKKNLVTKQTNKY